MEKQDQSSRAVVELTKAAVARVDPALFTRYKGGWPEAIGLSLWDAVYSMSAHYSGVERGVVNLAERLRADGVSTDSLRAVAELDEDVVVGIMGRGRVAPGKSASTTKAAAAREAARRIGELGVDTADELRTRASEKEGISEVLRAYTSVYGLGKVTGEYFLMLLGVPGLKADRMLTEFVSRAAGRPVSSGSARAVLAEVYEELVADKALDASLIQFDHGIWLHQRSAAS